MKLVSVVLSLLTIFSSAALADCHYKIDQPQAVSVVKFTDMLSAKTFLTCSLATDKDGKALRANGSMAYNCDDDQSTLILNSDGSSSLGDESCTEDNDLIQFNVCDAYPEFC